MRLSRDLPALLAALALGVTASLTLASPAAASDTDAGLMSSDNVNLLSTSPSQVGISGCFMKTAPLFVTSGLDSVRVFDITDAAHPELVGVLPSVQFENEAMNCGERRTEKGVERFVLIGVDLYQTSPGDIQHTNVGGKELVVVDVTTPSSPRIRSRVAGTTSTHTVACVNERNCTFAYSAGGRSTFSIFDLRNLDAPREVDGNRKEAGLQPFATPTGGHKWNFDAAGYGTHTGWNGASIWKTTRPARPRLVTTTGDAGMGTDPAFEGWNDFILHNSFRPNAKAFKPGRKPSFRNGNVLLATEEDYEQTDCSLAGSFQTWWVKRLDGKPSSIVPLDKVELSDLGTFPLPRGAFCSSHWFDFRPGGIVAVGFYGGGTQLIDARNPRALKPYGHAVWGASEVWDSMWVPIYNAQGKQTRRVSNIVYSIDLVRGLDVYAVDLPGKNHSARPTAAAVPTRTVSQRASDSAMSVGLVGGAMVLTIAVRRRTRRKTT
ncbi:hypothetical protein [Nocardioides sp.]|uniref:hypothetical protein n=1 Tax=Nocardioides sp. TaxID=35761 RepID=UPI003564EE0E